MGEYVAIVGAIIAAAGMGYSSYSSYEQGKAQKKANRAQAEALMEQQRLQYEESLKQAKIAEDKAGIAQIQGEQEAAKRSRQLAAAIGATYANWAGNGLLVDATGDTLTSVLTAQVSEGQADISTIKDNAAIETWNFLEQKRSLITQANIDMTAAENQASALKTAGDMAYSAGVNGATGTAITRTGQLAVGVAEGDKTYGWFGNGKGGKGEKIATAH